MKKVLSTLGLIAFGTLFSQQIAFDKLYGNNDPVNYYLGHYPVTGTDGLAIYWDGGIRLQTSTGVGLQLVQNGSIGIGTTLPIYKLDVRGTASFRGIISGDTNSWIFHTPDDNTRMIHIVPKNMSNTDWDWDKGLVINGENSNAQLKGKFEAKEIKVTLSPTADFVFEEDYNLPKLEEVEKHIKDKKHLPEIASAKEMEKEGVNIGEFQIKLLQKIEELTLYSIEQNKQIKDLQEQNTALQSQSKKFEKQLEQLISEKK